MGAPAGFILFDAAPRLLFLIKAGSAQQLSCVRHFQVGFNAF
jgi:hypothetical protein